MRKLLIPVFSVFISGMFAQSKYIAKYYRDGHGGEVLVPQGDLAFADEIVSYIKGFPPAVAGDSSLALGIPDYDGRDGNFVSLGCGGSITFRFNNNCITDVSGVDIYIFEMGKYVEKTSAHISRDGQTWLSLGEIAGGQSSIDIAPFVKQGEVFSYLKLTDLKTACSVIDHWPGADIDAVAAIGSALNYSINSSVLFETGKSVLKKEAIAELDKILLILKNYPGASLLIEGHTDDVGKGETNKTLSANRAEAVKKYFSEKLGGKNVINTAGFGEERPVASNSTDAGKEKNRRVEVIIIPKR